METIYAALLLHKAQKKITETNIENVLKAADVDVDKAQLKKVVAGLKEADIEAIIMLWLPLLLLQNPQKEHQRRQRRKRKKRKRKNLLVLGLSFERSAKWSQNSNSLIRS